MVITIEINVIVCASRIPPTTWLIRAKVDSFASFTRVEHSRKVSRLPGQLTENGIEHNDIKLGNRTRELIRKENKDSSK